MYLVVFCFFYKTFFKCRAYEIKLKLHLLQTYGRLNATVFEIIFSET